MAWKCTFLGHKRLTIENSSYLRNKTSVFPILDTYLWPQPFRLKATLRKVSNYSDRCHCIIFCKGQSIQIGTPQLYYKGCARYISKLPLCRKLKTDCTIAQHVLSLETHFQYEFSIMGRFGQSGLQRKKKSKLPFSMLLLRPVFYVFMGIFF